MSMTREEEIFFQSNKYGLELFNNDTSIDYNDCAFHFRMGARFADSLPKSPWISVKDDLPSDNTELYLIYCEVRNKNSIENKHREIYLANFDRKTSLWYNIESYNNYFFNVLYWMPIPELPKE